MKKSNIVWIIRILVSAIFILSAVAKLYPNPVLSIKNFEKIYLFNGIGLDLSLSKVLSRLLIGLEFSMAVLILLPYYLKKIVIPSIITLLSIFSIHLAMQAFGGIASNCGCFGELIPMSPLQALIKNILTIGLLIIPLTIFKDSFKEKQDLNPITNITLIFSLLMFVFVPSSSTFSDESIAPENLKKTINDFSEKGLISDEASFKFDSIFKLTKQPNDKPVLLNKNLSKYSKYFSNIGEGKKLLCFFSPTCEHCMETGKKITELIQKHPNLMPDYDGIKVLFMDETGNGSELEIKEYFNFVGYYYDYRVLPDDIFVPLFWGERDFPGVLYLNNGSEEIFFDGINENEFNADKLMNLLKVK